MTVTTCPRCAYDIPEDRQGGDECPSCGVVYAKFDPARSEMARMRAVVDTEPSRPPVILIGLALAIALTLVAMLGIRQSMLRRADLPPPDAPTEAVAVDVATPARTDDGGAAPGLTASQLLQASDLDEYGEIDPDRERSSLSPSQIEAARAAVATEPSYDVGAGDEPIPTDLRVVTTIDGVDDLQWVGWYEGVEGYERGLEQARDMNRPLVVYFHTDWCRYCRALNKNFLPDPLVRRFLSNVLRVHVNPESSAEAKALGVVFGVAGYPSFFVLPPGAGPSGANRVHPFRNGTTITPQEFAAECEVAAKAS